MVWGHTYVLTIQDLLIKYSIYVLLLDAIAETTRINRSVSITGISKMQSVVRYVAQITITPAYRDGSVYTTTAFIFWLLTKYFEIFPNWIDIAYSWKHVVGLELANRNPMNSDPIDIISVMIYSACSFSTVFEKVPNMSLPRKILILVGFCLDQ